VVALLMGNEDILISLLNHGAAADALFNGQNMLMIGANVIESNRG